MKTVFPGSKTEKPVVSNEETLCIYVEPPAIRDSMEPEIDDNKCQKENGEETTRVGTRFVSAKTLKRDVVYNPSVEHLSVPS